MPDMTTYQAPKTLNVTLPNFMGEVTVQPLTSERIKVWSTALLLEPNIYSFNAVMQQAQGRWYYVNKAEIGVTGGRPSPKKCAGALELIAGTINAALKSVEFQARFAELQEQEEIRAAKREHDRLVHEHQMMRRRIQDDMIYLAQRRQNIVDLENTIRERQEELLKFEAEHPDIVNDGVV